MKPLLILPPAPMRWNAAAELLRHESAEWLADLRVRLSEGVQRGSDAFAVIQDGSTCLAAACIRRRRDFGVLGHLFVRPEQRGRGRARLLLQTLLSWFDMSGGKWLYLTSPAELADGLFSKFGFCVLRRCTFEAVDTVTMLRVPAGISEDPLERSGQSDKPGKVGDLQRGDWPLLVALLQHRLGADPRISLNESAVAAEAVALDLIDQQERGACRLVAVRRSGRIVSAGSVATDRTDSTTHAVLIPPTGHAAGLREALIELGQSRGYSTVSFPMEALIELSGSSPSD